MTAVNSAKFDLSLLICRQNGVHWIQNVLKQSHLIGSEQSGQPMMVRWIDLTQHCSRDVVISAVITLHQIAATVVKQQSLLHVSASQG